MGKYNEKNKTVDYKYIEQLLERYFQCETSLEEERILRTFFSQKEVPVALLPYRDLFVYEQAAIAEETLGDDFDDRIMSIINEEDNVQVKARVITLPRRLRPLFRAAAVVGIILSLGLAAQMPYERAALVDAQEFAAAHAKDTVTIQTTATMAMADSMAVASEDPKRQ